MKKCNIFYSSPKTEKIINETGIDSKIESIDSTIISKKEKCLGKILGWIIDSVIDHTINISKKNLY